ncbi:MAG: hypothetical protein AAGA90_08900, partial [Actinomycetota bacterium]
MIAVLAVILLAATIATPALQRAAMDLEERIEDALSSSQTVQPGVVPEGLTAEEWADIQAQIAALQATPELSPQVTVEPAATPTLRLGRFAEAAFATAGVTYTFDEQTVRLGTVSVGGPIAAAAPEADPAEGRVVYDRGNVEEWFVETDRGIQQGWTIAQAPAGVTDELVIEVALGTDLILVPVADDAIALVDASGNGVATYEGLLAWDADGVDLPASMTVVEDRIAITVDVEGATYPITVDPTFTADQTLTPIATRAGDRQGAALATAQTAGVADGTVLVSTAPGSDQFGDGIGAANVYVWDTVDGDWDVEAQLQPTPAGTPDDDDLFGWSVAIAGDWLAVGAPGHDANGTDSGAVYLYDASGGTWQFSDVLYQCDPGAFAGCGDVVGQGGAALAGFGFDVAFIDEDNLVVSAPRSEVGSAAGGQVFIYQNQGSGHRLQSTAAVIDNPNDTSNDRFGFAVDADANGNIVVGAPAVDFSLLTDAGGVYWYTWNGTTLSAAEEIGSPLNGTNGSLRGTDVGVLEEDAVTGGEFVFIVGTFDPVAESGLGADIFVASSGSIPGSTTETRTQSVGTALADTELELDLTLDGLIIGLPNQRNAFFWGYDSATDTFTGEGSVTNIGATFEDEYGRAVLLVNDGSVKNVVIGAPGRTDSTSQRTFPDAGRVFTKVLGNPVSDPFAQQLFSIASTNGDRFGGSIAIDGNFMAVAADGDDNEVRSAGAIYLYTRIDGTSPWALGDVINRGGANAADDNFVWSMAVRGTTVAASQLDTLTGASEVYVWEQLSPTSWAQKGGVIVAPGANDQRFGESLAFGVDEDHLLLGASDADPGSDGGVYEVFYSGGWGTPTTFASPINQGSNFGRTLASYVDATDLHVVVGDSRDNEFAGLDQGGAFTILTRSLVTPGWSTVAKIGGDQFLSSGGVAIHGDRVVASSFDNLSLESTVQIFEGPAWSSTPVATLTGTQYGQFDINASRLAVGTDTGTTELFNLPLSGTLSTPDDIFDPAGSNNSPALALDDGITVAMTDQLQPTGGTDTGRGWTANFAPTSSVIGENSIDIEKNWMAIGNPEDDAVYVFEHDGSSWIQQQVISGTAGTSFGAAVALVERALIVGAPGDDGLGIDAGAAFVYKRADASDTYVADGAISGAGQDAGDRFGFSLSAVLTSLFVGAPGDDVDGADGGAVHAFVNIANYQTTFRDGIAGSEFGYDLDTGTHDTAVAVAIGAPGTSNDQGDFHLYTGTSAASMSQFSIDASGKFVALNPGARYGEEISADWMTFNQVLITASYDDDTVYLHRVRVDNGAADDFTQLTDASGSVVGLDSSGDTMVMVGSTVERFSINGGTTASLADSFRSDTFTTPAATYTDIAVEGNFAIAVSDAGSGAFTDLSSNQVISFVPGVDDGNARGRKLFAPEPAEGDKFGRAVAVDGDTLVVGAEFAERREDGSGQVHVFTYDGSAWVHQQELLPPTARESRDSWGRDVAISGNTIAVLGGNGGANHIAVWATRPNASAPFTIATDAFRDVVANAIDTDGQTLATVRGISASVFTGGPASWTGIAEKTVTGLSSGRDIAVQGNLLAISETPNGTTTNPSSNHGEVGLYALAPFTGSSFQTLVGDRPGGAIWSDAFGQSIDIDTDGSTLIAGAPFDLDRAGRVYVFEGCDVACNKAYVEGSDAGGETGYTVSIKNGRALFSSRLAGNASLSGASDLIVRGASGTWSATSHRYDAPDADGIDQYIFVALAGEWVVVGAGDEDQAGVNAGAVMVWPVPPDQKVVPTGRSGANQANLSPDQSFRVDISGDTMVVGWPLSNNGSGSADVFVRNADGIWTLQQTLTPAFSTGANFGSDVAVDGDTVVLGGPFHVGASNGGVSIWSRSGDVWSDEGIVTAGGNGGWLGWSVDIANGIIVAGAPAQAANSGLVVVISGGNGSWAFDSLLIPATPAPGEWVGWDVAIDATGVEVVAGSQLGILEHYTIGTGHIQTFDTGTTDPVENVGVENGRTAGLTDQGDAFVWQLSTGTSLGGVTYNAISADPTLDFDGSNLVIGDEDVLAASGEVRVFNYDGATWQPSATQPTITAPDAITAGRFGTHVALDNGYLAVLAQDDDNARGRLVGSVYVSKLATVTPPDNPSLQFDLGLAAGQQPTVPVTSGIAIADIDAELLEEAGEGTLAASPLGQTDLENSPLDEVKLSDTEIPEAILANPELRDLPLIDISLDLPGGWSGILAGTIFENRPLQDITLGEVLPTSGPNASPVGSTIQALNLSDLDVNGTPLTALPLTALVLGDLPLTALSTNTEICEAFGPSFPGLTCGQIVSQVGNLSVTEASLQGLPLTALPLTALPLTALPLTALPLNGLQLGSLELEQSPLTALPLTALPLTALGLDSIPLTALPLTALPLTALPLTALGLDSTPLTALPLTALQLEGIPLTALEVEGAPLTALPLTALPLTALYAGDDEPLQDLPLDGGADWCTTLAELGNGYDCTTGVNVASTTLVDLAVRGVPLTALPLTALPLTALPLTALPLTALPLTALPLTALPLTALPLTALPLTALPAGSLNIAGTTLADVPLTALDVQGSPLTALPLTALDVATLPLTALPLTALPLTALPLTALPLTALNVPGGTVGSTPLTALDVLSSPLTALPLTALPLTALDCSRTDCDDGTLGDAILDGALDPAAVDLEDLLPALGGISLGDLVPFFNTITAGELEAAIAGVNLDLGDLPSFDGITLGDLPSSDPLVSQLVLGQLQSALGDVSLADIATALGLTEAEMQPILGSLGLGDLDTFGNITLGDALANGDGGLNLGLENLGDFLGFLNLQQMLDAGEGTNSPNYGGETLGSAESDPLLDLGSLTLEDLIGLAVPQYNTLTLGDLLEELELSGNLLGFVLADLLAGLVGLEDVAFGSVDFTEVEAGSLPENTVPDVTFRAGFQVADTVNSQSVVVDVELPADATYVPGTATVNDGNGATPLEPIVGENTLQWTVFGVDAAEPHLIEFDVRPEVTIGATSLTGRGTVLGTDTTIPGSASVTVAEGLEPNDTPALATPVADDTVYLTYISTDTDLDVFEITLGERDRLAIQLSNLTADLDLVLYGVPTDTAVGAALSGTSDEAALSPITDPDGNNADTEIVDDFPRLDQDFPAAGLQLLDVSNASGEVDELIVTDALPAGTYYVQVHGANGARNRVPATLQIQTIEADTRPACSSLTDILGGSLPAATPGTLPVDLTGNTLFLVNEQRLEQLYGAAGRADVMNSLDALVLYLEANANLGLDPIVIPVEAYAGVQTAYAAWDDPANSEDACDPEVANAVVSQIITNAVDPIRDQLSHIIVVGGDDIIPMARIQDVTTIANEYDYRNELVGDINTANGANAGDVTSLSASFWESRYLSDDPYGESAARSLGDRFLYVPDVALGRLVENPSEIASALDHFVTFQGELDMDTATVLGYDFLTDATAEIADDLVAAGLTVDADLADGIDSGDGLPWDRVDAEEVLIPPGGGDADDLISFNGHFDHYRALPASGDQVPGFDDNVETSAIFDALPTTVLEGTLLFSAGCHGGLSVSDIQIGMTNGDWAQAAAAADALWIGNTGFGYGDTETIAYTEKLLELFTEEVTQPLLVGSATVPTTVGQAFTVAKNRFVAENAGFTVYDEKASMEATFYGLPIYRVDIPAQPAPAAPVNVPAPDATGTPALPVPVATGNTPVGTPRGTYWANFDADGNEQIINSPGRPVQPQLTTDVSVVDPADPTQLDQIAHGGLVLDMTSTYQSGVDPVVASVIFDEASERPEPELGNEVFPARPLVINQSTTATGQRQTMSVATGQFRPGSLTQRLDSDIDVVVYYADPSETDFTAPRVGRVERTIDANGLLTITLNVQDDAGDVDRVYILLAEDPGAGTVDWQGFDLSQVGATTTWAGSFQLDGNTDGIEFLVQAKDDAGNVGYATDKAGNFSSDAEPEPEPPAPVDLSIDIDPTNLDPGGSGWYTGSVDIDVTVDGTATATVDGVVSTVSDGDTITVSGDGIHTVELETPIGEMISTLIRIDTTGAPTFAASVPVEGGVYSPAVPSFYDFVCSDPSLESCAALVNGTPVTPGTPLPTTGGAYVLNVTATDALGNSESFTVNFSVSTPLDVDVDDTNLAGNGSGWYDGPVEITATASSPIEYSIDGNPAVSLPSGGSFTLATSGQFVVAITTDAGESFSETIRIDSTGPPVVTPVLPVDGGSYAFDGGDTYAFSCTDVSPTTCEALLVGTGPVAVGDVLPSAIGSYVLEITGTDVVGDSVTETVNFAVTSSLDVDIDDTNLAGNGSGWYTGPVDITVSAASAITYIVGAGAPTSLPSGGTFTVNGEGANTVVISTAGGESFTTTIEIDATGAPTFSEGTPTSGATYPFDSGLSYAWTCTDTSLVSCDGSVGGNPVAVGDPLPTAAGPYTLVVTGTDIVGNS